MLAASVGPLVMTLSLAPGAHPRSIANAGPTLICLATIVRALVFPHLRADDVVADRDGGVGRSHPHGLPLGVVQAVVLPGGPVPLDAVPGVHHLVVEAVLLPFRHPRLLDLPRLGVGGERR